MLTTTMCMQKAFSTHRRRPAGLAVYVTSEGEVTMRNRIEEADAVAARSAVHNAT